MNTYTEAHPTITLGELKEAYGLLETLRSPVEIWLSESIKIKDEYGPYIIGMDNPNILASRSLFSSRTPNRTVVMHPQTFMDYCHLFPVGIPVNGLAALERWKKKKTIQLIKATWPTITARIPYAVLTVVMLLIVVLLGG